MSDHKLAEALRKAEHALQQVASSCDLHPALVELVGQAITTGREALAAHEAEQQAGEAVAYGMPNSALTGSNRWMLLREEVPTNDQYGGALWVPLFTHPQQPLTREQIGKVSADAHIAFCLDKYPTYEEAITRAIEAELGITKDTK